MHPYPVTPSPRTHPIVRCGVIASAAALAVASLAAPAAAQDPGSPPEQYEVVSGDSLSAIAGDHGLDPVTGWRLLFDANPEIADPDVIVPGQVLRIPAADEDLEDPAAPAEDSGAPDGGCPVDV